MDGGCYNRKAATIMRQAATSVGLQLPPLPLPSHSALPCRHAHPLAALQPIYWEHDHALYCYPLPDAMVLADAAPAAAFEFDSCSCLNPVRSLVAPETVPSLDVCCCAAGTGCRGAGGVPVPAVAPCLLTSRAISPRRARWLPALLRPTALSRGRRKCATCSRRQRRRTRRAWSWSLGQKQWWRWRSLHDCIQIG